MDEDEDIMVMETLREALRSLNTALDLITQALQQNHAEHGEMRDGMIDLDHRIANVERYGIATRDVLLTLQDMGAPTHGN